MFTVYSKDNCSFCTAAKMLLDTRSIDYKEVKLDRDITKEQLLTQVPGIKSFPYIEDAGKPIGGYSELQKYLTAQEVGRMSL